MPTALSGYRPRATGTASVTENYLETLIKNPVTTGPATYTKSQGATVVSAAGMTVTQTFLNGFQTANRTRQAEGQVFAARETLDHRADRAAQRRHRLHESAARRGDPRAPAT